MSLFSAKSKSATATLEKDLTDLCKRRDQLKSKLDRASIDAERAAGERRRLLLEVDEPDAGSVATAEAACRAANEARAAIEDALRHAGERILALQENIRDQKDRAERAAAAEELERRALSLDMAAGDFKDAIAIVAKRYGALITAMRDSGRIVGAQGLPVVPEIVAVMALDAAVRSFEPSLVPCDPGLGMPPAPTDAHAVVQASLSSPMRALAEAIRKGEAAVALPQQLPKRRAPVRFSDVEVIIYEPVRYIDATGQIATTLAGGQTLPEPVATAVTRLGLGEPAGTPSARAWLERNKGKLMADYGFTGQFADSGVDLYALAQAV